MTLTALAPGDTGPMGLRDIERMLDTLPEAELQKLASMPHIREEMKAFKPTPGPQYEAYHSEAFLLLYGGQAGGGKTALIEMLAMNEHSESLIMRRQFGDVAFIYEDIIKQRRTRDGFRGGSPAFQRLDEDRWIDYGGAKDVGDEESWRGRPHDFLGIDEASQFAEKQVDFLKGWVRTTRPNQKCRIVLATNPPTSELAGQWLKEWFAPWLDQTHELFIPGIDPKHPYIGQPSGKLLWAYSDADGKTVWVDGPEPIEVDGRKQYPQSRTFIPAKLEDNPYLWNPDTEQGRAYSVNLDNLKDVQLRKALRDGNWMIAADDDEWQVIPTKWIIEAQDRWTEDGWKETEMTAMALDCAGGGKDPAALAYRHGGWFGKIVTFQGEDTADGSAMVGRVIRHRRHGCPIIVDAQGGYAGAVIERLKDNNIAFQRFVASETSAAAATGTGLRFANKRAEAWWRLREALDPDQEGGSIIALPPDPQLRAELAAVHYKHGPRGLGIEDKTDIRKRIGRSTNLADSVVMCLSEGDRAAARRDRMMFGRKPKVHLGYGKQKRHMRR